MIIRRTLVNGLLLLALSSAGMCQTSADADVTPDAGYPDGSGSRPSFLPERRTKPANPPTEDDASPPTEDDTGPRTMKTEIELPVPEPTAQAPDVDATQLAGPTGSRSVIFENEVTGAGSEKSSSPNPNDPAPEGNRPRVLFGDESPDHRKQTSEQRVSPLVSPSVRAVAHPPTKPPVAAPEDPATLLREKRYGEVEPVALRNEDAGLAKALGWAYYKAGRSSSAATWFQRAIQWDESDYEAAYGLALVLTRQGEYDKAEETARWRLQEYPPMRKVMGDILTARAVATYKSKDYQRSLDLFWQVETYRSLSRDEEIVRAWDYFQNGDLTRAAQEFEKLYTARPDKFAASGVFATYAQQRNWARLEELSRTYGGPVADLYREYVAQRYYDRRLYGNAYAADPQKYPQLSGYTSPSVETSGYVRFKSGSEGTSQLREIRGDVSGDFYQDTVNRLWADVGGTSLDSGHLQNGAFIGQAPLDGPRSFISAPRTSYNSLFDARVGYERLGRYTPAVELGVSPVGGAVGPTSVGSLSLTGKPEWGEWLVDLYRSSVKQSILSYTGLRDPYTGKTWGRVSEDGINLTGDDQLTDRWSLFGQAGASVLEGENVDTNSHIKAGVALNYQISHPDFLYLTVGPAFNFEHYAKNLSFFTYGHGGYFSPDYLFQGAVALRFMTKEARPYLVKGNLSLGLQSYKEDASPIFPLGNATGTYPGKSSQTYIADADLSGMILLSPHIAVGASVGYDKTGDYSEFFASAFLRFFFEPRRGLFESDFGTSY